MGRNEDLIPPALINGVHHNVPVREYNSANEEDFDIMLNRDNLRIVDPGLLLNVLVFGRDFHANRLKS